jgi:hypothetical protein
LFGTSFKLVTAVLEVYFTFLTDTLVKVATALTVANLEESIAL